MTPAGPLALAGLCLAASCATAPRPAPVGAAPPRSDAPRAAISVPPGSFDDLGEGLVRTVPVSVANQGHAPLVVLAIRAEGAGEGERRLAIPAPGGGLRAFGFVPPGQSGRWRLGVFFPTPGSGVLRLVARVRALAPGTPGRLMEEIHLPAAGGAASRVRRFTVRVPPRAFTRAAAEARIGGPADDAVYCRTLHAWVLRRGNSTFLVEVSDTIPFPGLTIAAAVLLDASPGPVPVIDEEGRLEAVPKGPVLLLLLDRARRTGERVTVVPYSRGRKAIRVGR